MYSWPLELNFQKKESQIGIELKICGEESSELLEYFQMYDSDDYSLKNLKRRQLSNDDEQLQDDSCVDRSVDEEFAGWCAWDGWNDENCFGTYDEGTFTSSIACCACGGGYDLSNCIDDTTILDSYEQSCEWYQNKKEKCGWYDNQDFIASEAC